MTDDPRRSDFDYGEKREDGQFENYPTISEEDEPEFKQKPRKTYTHDDPENGCGERTTMTGELPESIARDPEWYNETFCVGCGEHVPVEEVTWADGEDWVVEKSESLIVKVNEKEVAVPVGFGSTPREFLDALGWPDKEYDVYRNRAGALLTEDDRCSKPMEVSEGDEFVVVPRHIIQGDGGYDEFGGEVVLHVEVDGKPVKFGTGPARGNVGLSTSTVPAEFEVGGKTVTIEVEGFLEPVRGGGV